MQVPCSHFYPIQLFLPLATRKSIGQQSGGIRLARLTVCYGSDKFVDSYDLGATKSDRAGLLQENRLFMLLTNVTNKYICWFPTSVSVMVVFANHVDNSFFLQRTESCPLNCYHSNYRFRLFHAAPREWVPVLPHMLPPYFRRLIGLVGNEISAQFTREICKQKCTIGNSLQMELKVCVLLRTRYYCHNMSIKRCVLHLADQNESYSAKSCLAYRAPENGEHVVNK